MKVLLGSGLAAALLLTGCGSDQPDPNASASPAPAATDTPSAPTSESASPTASPTPSPTAPKVTPSTNLDQITVTGSVGQAPKVKVPTPWAIDETRTKVLVGSNGPLIAEDATVTVDYYGVDGRTGKKFDDSYSRGAPASFPLDQVVPGFKKGLLGQKLGSRVLIAMPGTDAYDSAGGRPDSGIEVGDTLIFVVDIKAPLTGPKGTAVKPAPGLPTVTDQAGVPEITIPKAAAPTKLEVQPLIKGSGDKVAAQSTITFNYRWVRWSDGSVIEETYSSGKPATAPLAKLLKGMQTGLSGQPVGSRVLLVIPPSESYPEGNTQLKINKGETLVMVVDLLQVS